jgi:phosphopentomutase
MGRDVICNRPYNGVAAIEDFGEQHLRSGHLIMYTSEDSVLQLAAHVDRLSPARLYEACLAARRCMSGPDAVGRVIARPFSGRPGEFQRTGGRRDFALPPPGPSYLTELSDAGVTVHGVGKVGDLFAGVGIDEVHRAPTNREAISATTELLRTGVPGLIFTNLIETDQVYGHRRDTEGFHTALREVDGAVGVWASLCGPDDLLIITADHGCDPTSPGTEHTREYAPLLAAFGARQGRRHDGPMADVGASTLRWLARREAPDLPGSALVA